MFTKAQIKILELLDNDRRWWYGLELVKASDGKISRGSVYVHLVSLKEKSFVDSREQNDEEFNLTPDYPDKLRRTLYRITEGGIHKRTQSEVKSFGLTPQLA